MSEAVQLALIAAMPPLVASVLTLIAVIITGIRLESQNREQAGKLDHVVTATNSTLTAALAQVNALELQIRVLTEKLDGANRMTARDTPAGVSPGVEEPPL